MGSRLALLACLAVALLAWGLWPVGDASLEIRFDPDETRAAKSFLAASVLAPAVDRPNFVVIIADDLGKYDTTIYGAAPTPTPNLAELAAAGVKFTSAYVTSPVCSPSRAALLTGRYQQRFGFELLTHDRYARNRLEWWFARTFFSRHGWHTLAELSVPTRENMERQGLPPSEISLAELLAKHGYRTAIFGKWHLGFGDAMLPEARGFQEQYGFYDAFSIYADPEDPNIVNARGKYFADRYQWRRGRSGGSAIRRNGVIVAENEYLTAAIAREAVTWIESVGDEPFFAYVPFNAPHAPLQAPREYVERFAHVANPDQRVYYGMIAALDDAVGEILAALDRGGLRDDTLVFFLSDNGAAAYTGVVDNAPLAGGKLTNLEGGLNVPYILQWPSRVARNGVYEHPVSALDVFATIASAAGAELPEGRPSDGVDLLPFVRGERLGLPHEVLFWRAAGHRAVRAGRYKLISDSQTGARVLYDMASDPFEKNDLLEQEPALANQLEERLRQWESEQMPPGWPPAMEYRFSHARRRFIFPL